MADSHSEAVDLVFGDISMSHPLRIFTVIRFAIFALAMMAVGCARPMALRRATTLSLEDRSIAIFTLKTSNRLAPIYRPEVQTVELIPGGSRRGQKFKVSRPFRKAKKEFYEYLISIDLKPGSYTIGKIRGRAMFPNIEVLALIYGEFRFPLNLHFDLEPKAIVYLGQITMTNRKRSSGEPRSGLIIPLVDQAVTGFSNGTFEVTVLDRYDADIADFIKVYPVLQNHEIANGSLENASPDGSCGTSGTCLTP